MSVFFASCSMDRAHWSVHLAFKESWLCPLPSPPTGFHMHARCKKLARVFSCLFKAAAPTLTAALLSQDDDADDESYAMRRRRCCGTTGIPCKSERRSRAWQVMLCMHIIATLRAGNPLPNDLIKSIRRLPARRHVHCCILFAVCMASEIASLHGVRNIDIQIHLDEGTFFLQVIFIFAFICARAMLRCLVWQR
jgi:hypothetical protein